MVPVIIEAVLLTLPNYNVNFCDVFFHTKNTLFLQQIDRQRVSLIIMERDGARKSNYPILLLFFILFQTVDDNHPSITLETILEQNNCEGTFWC